MSCHRSVALAMGTFVAAALAPATASPQATPGAPALDQIHAFQGSSLAPVVERFRGDLSALERRWQDIPYSAARQARMGEFLTGWSDALDALTLAPDDLEGGIDHVLLGNEVRYRRELLAREGRLVAEVLPLLPFADEIVALLDIRHFRERWTVRRSRGIWRRWPALWTTPTAR